LLSLLLVENQATKTLVGVAVQMLSFLLSAADRGEEG